LAAFFRLKAADFPEQRGHFPGQQRPKPPGDAALGWKFRPKAPRDTAAGLSTRTIVELASDGQPEWCVEQAC
jgi:hypothetical protein